MDFFIVQKQIDSGGAYVLVLRPNGKMLTRAEALSPRHAGQLAIDLALMIAKSRSCGVIVC